VHVCSSYSWVGVRGVEEDVFMYVFVFCVSVCVCACVCLCVYIACVLYVREN
jgi:hypothetical protein